MDTALRLEQFALGHAYELQVIGIPKTIDNDLMETDHTPGYASAAAFSLTRRAILARITVRCHLRFAFLKCSAAMPAGS
jgi:6-phosphofructokinase